MTPDLSRYYGWDHFWAFVRERDAARYRREVLGQPRPWTADPIIHAYRFTNVYREYDAGTRWFRAWSAANVTSEADLLYYSMIYRRLNYVPTYERFGLPSRDVASITAWHARLLEHARSGRQVGTGRHMTQLVAAFVARGHEGFRDRLGLVLAWTDDAMLNQLTKTVLAAGDGYDVVAALLPILGIGIFTAVQTTCDYVGDERTNVSSDVRVPLGIGSRRAVTAMTTGCIPGNDDMRKKIDLAAERATYDEVVNALHDYQVTPPTGPPLTHVDVEHSLCEWFKYVNIAHGNNTSLARYR